MKRLKVLSVLTLGLGMAGCSVSTASFNSSSGMGGAVVGSIGTPDVAPAPPPAMGPFLEGPLGQRLGEADRDRAFHAELDALQSGERKSWRGVKGNFGYVVPAATAGPDGCRSFSHTVYIAGRPQTGSGSGCPTPDGSWKVTS